MSRRFKDKVIEFFDKENSGENPYPYIATAVITITLSKLLSVNANLCILSAITVVSALGLVMQLLKKEKNVHNIICYLFATIFGVFMTYMIYVMTNSDDSRSGANIKILVCGLVFFIDIFAIYGLLAGKYRVKLPAIIIIVLLTVLAIATVIFLPADPTPL